MAEAMTALDRRALIGLLVGGAVILLFLMLQGQPQRLNEPSELVRKCTEFSDAKSRAGGSRLV